MSERCLINQTGWSIYLERPASRATSVLKCSTQKKLGLWLGLQFALDYSTFNLFEHENMVCQVKKILHQNDLAKTLGKPKMLTTQHHKPNQETPKGYLVDRDCHRDKHQDTQRASNFYQTLPDQARPQSKVYHSSQTGWQHRYSYSFLPIFQGPCSKMPGSFDQSLQRWHGFPNSLPSPTQVVRWRNQA